jgi:hypothetical protein
MSKRITIGQIQGEKPHPLTMSIDALIESRLLVQANSGGGKSNTIRLLAEKIAPHVPCVIIDPEGEFATLREKVDLVLVGEGGELEATPKNAGELALKLLTLGVSAVIDLYNLVPAERREWVRRYCENIIAAPRRLWRPFVLFIDEAQEFAPEKAEAVSHGPLIEVMTKARKRDMCPILVTPRLAMLDADARGPINNFLIGRATLDIDYKRAGEILGMPPAERRTLATLSKGQFHAFGPAFGHDGVCFAKLDQAETRPTKTGAATKAVPAPSAAIRAVVPELEALAQPANPDEVGTIDAARKRIAELRKEVTAARREADKAAKVKPAALTTGIDPATVNKAIDGAVATTRRELKASLAVQLRAISKTTAHLRKWAESLTSDLGSLDAGIGALATLLEAPIATDKVERVEKIAMAAQAATRRAVHENVQRRAERIVLGNGDTSHLPVGEKAVLRALIQYPDGLERDQLTVLTGYKRSTRNTYLQRLSERGYVSGAGERVQATDAGIAALPDAEPLPTGQALQDFWMAKLPKGEADILDVLIRAYPNAVDRDALSDATGFKRSTRNTYLQRMAAKELVTGGEAVRASDTLF